MSTSRPEIVICSGEPAGIGPELCAQLLAESLPSCNITLLGDRDLLLERARAIGLRLAPDLICHHPLAIASQPGQPDSRNAKYVLDLLDAAVAGVQRGEFAAMVTAPVQKSTIAASGVRFSGHTEYLAELTGSEQPVMMLVGGGLRVALATTHLPLQAVPRALSIDGLLRILRIMHADLRNLWGIDRPRIAVCGLNPHAGENGLLGTEEHTVIGPAVEAARSEGIDAIGPLSADTVFVRRDEGFDAHLAMFHDQGLPVLKFASFGHAVNVTLGLPLIRTSVDHGTALALAGSGKADVGSLKAAVELAVELAERRALRSRPSSSRGN